MKIWVFLILLALLIWITGFNWLNLHESVHKQIFSRYNITSESHIVSHVFLAGMTIPDEENLENCNDSCKFQHAMNDIIGYNLAALVFASWALFLACIAYKKMQRKKNKGKT